MLSQNKSASESQNSANCTTFINGYNLSDIYQLNGLSLGFAPLAISTNSPIEWLSAPSSNKSNVSVVRVRHRAQKGSRNARPSTAI